MRRLLKQRFPTVQPDHSPIVRGEFGAVTIVAEDRPDVQVALKGLLGFVLIRCDRLWIWCALVRAVTIRVPRDFGYLIQPSTRGRTTIKVGKTSGDLYADTTGGPVEIEADNPFLSIRTWGGNIDVHGNWGDQALTIWGESGRAILRENT